MFQNFNLGYPEGFLYLKGQKSRTTYCTWCPKSDPKGGGGGSMKCYNFFSHKGIHIKKLGKVKRFKVGIDT